MRREELEKDNRRMIEIGINCVLIRI